MDVLYILLWVGAVIWALLLVQGLLNGWLVKDLEKINAPTPRSWPSVSFVVPARNEERGIRQAVTSFCRQDYPDFEVIVVNDRSTDATSLILHELQEEYANLIVVEGTEPPDGWLGKPNAMCLGAARANGDWILLADADVVHEPDVLRRAMAIGLTEDAGMVTLLPRFVSGGVVEAALMSAHTFFFFVAMPMFLVRASKSALFAIGSGVFILLRRDVIDACGGLACLRQAIVDDMEIGFRVKRAGYPLAVAYAGELINLRMYHGVREAICGFTKNAFPSIRRAPYLLILYYFMAAVLSFLPYYGFAAGLAHGRFCVPAAISLGAMHAVFALISWRYRQPWYIIVLNPLRELVWLWIFTRSFVVYLRKGIVWRERSYGRTAQ